MKKEVKIRIAVACVLVAFVLLYVVVSTLSNKDDDVVVIETTADVIMPSKPEMEETSPSVEETTTVETMAESSVVYETLVDATDTVDRVSSELLIDSPEAELLIQTYVDTMQEGTLEHEFITEDMIRTKTNGEKSTVFISGYNIPGFDYDEVLLFDVNIDGTISDYEDWAILDEYLYSIKDIGRVPETASPVVEIPDIETLSGDRGTGTVHQSFPNKVVVDGYEIVDSRMFDNDDYCDTELPETAYLNRFATFVCNDIDFVNFPITDFNQASLDVWNFTNAYAVPLECDRFEFYGAKSETINGTDYAYVSIEGSGAHVPAAPYGKYLMLLHGEDGIVYSDFYIWKE